MTFSQLYKLLLILIASVSITACRDYDVLSVHSYGSSVEVNEYSGTSVFMTVMFFSNYNGNSSAMPASVKFGVICSTDLDNISKEVIEASLKGTKTADVEICWLKMEELTPSDESLTAQAVFNNLQPNTSYFYSTFYTTGLTTVIDSSYGIFQTMAKTDCTISDVNVKIDSVSIDGKPYEEVILSFEATNKLKDGTYLHAGGFEVDESVKIASTTTEKLSDNSYRVTSIIHVPHTQLRGSFTFHATPYILVSNSVNPEGVNQHVKGTAKDITLEKKASPIILSPKELVLNHEYQYITVEIIDENVYYDHAEPYDSGYWIHSSYAGSQAIGFYVYENTSHDVRSVKLYFSDRLTGAQDFVIVQQYPRDAIILAQDYYELTPEKQELSFEVSSNTDYSVNISVNWIKPVVTRGLTTKMVTFEIDENISSERREGTITFANSDNTVTQTVTVCQLSNGVFSYVTGSWSCEGGDEGDPDYHEKWTLKLRPDGTGEMLYTSTNSSEPILILVTYKMHSPTEGSLTMYGDPDFIGDFPTVSLKIEGDMLLLLAPDGEGIAFHRLT